MCQSGEPFSGGVARVRAICSAMSRRQIDDSSGEALFWRRGLKRPRHSTIAIVVPASPPWTIRSLEELDIPARNTIELD